MSKRHRDSRLQALQAKQLPYALNTALLYDELKNEPKDRGLGKVLLQAMQAAQGNFDHYQSQVEAFKRAHNEHGEETNHLKDKLVPHDHPRMEQNAAPGTGWSTLVNQRVGGIDANDLFTDPHFTPHFISMPLSILHVATIVQDIFPGHQVDTNGGIALAIYAGDNEGNYPGTRLAYSDVIDCSGPAFDDVDLIWTLDEPLEVGPGHYWFGGKWDGVDDSPWVNTADALGGYEGIIQGGQYDYDFATPWQYPDLDSTGEQIGTMGLYMNTWTDVENPPEWAGEVEEGGGDFEVSAWCSGLSFRST